jgi:hypothetical protein
MASRYVIDTSTENAHRAADMDGDLGRRADRPPATERYFLSRGLAVFGECVAKFSCPGVQCLVTTGMAAVCGTAPPIMSGPGR